MNGSRSDGPTADVGLEPVLVIMAKRPQPGRVKTRLVEDGFLTPDAAAQLATAMLQCTVDRLAAVGEVILAVTPDDAGSQLAADLGRPHLAVCRQGGGDLGQRLDRVWRSVAADRPIAFFGTDSPDLPTVGLEQVMQFLTGHIDCDLAVGPTHDGGYWTLAARGRVPAVLQRIDWGSAAVYDQTRARAAEAGLTLHVLPVWHDVDRPEDVGALRRRLAERREGLNAQAATERPLLTLAERIDELLGIER